MGKRRAESQMAYEQQEADQNSRLGALESQPAAAAAPPASGGMSQSAIDQLKQLGELKQQGILTDEEFEAQKAKILGS
jgi:hypothetical protein